jgi:hypothetical protein
LFIWLLDHFDLMISGLRGMKVLVLLCFFKLQ